MLVGHGRLFGYGERTSCREVRGQRVLCSNRRRRGGCGGTFTLWLASVVPRLSVRAATIFALLAALADGVSCARAWRAASCMTLRTGYRTKARLALAGPAIRTALLSRAPPPTTNNPSPYAQLLAHLHAVLGPQTDSFSHYQLHFQRSLFE
jgi:hypothetical protein